jgi:hypothetical protein
MTKRRYTGRGGPNNRRLRYPIKLTVYISEESMALLKERSNPEDRVWPATLARLSIDKDNYIYKAEKKRHEEIVEELGEDESKP